MNIYHFRISINVQIKHYVLRDLDINPLKIQKILKEIFILIIKEIFHVLHFNLLQNIKLPEFAYPTKSRHNRANFIFISLINYHK